MRGRAFAAIAWLALAAGAPRAGDPSSRSLARSGPFETIAFELPGTPVSWSVERPGTPHAALLLLLRPSPTRTGEGGGPADAGTPGAPPPRALPPCPGEDPTSGPLAVMLAPLAGPEPVVVRGDVPPGARGIVGLRGEGDTVRRLVDLPGRLVELGASSDEDVAVVEHPGLQSLVGAPSASPPVAIVPGRMTLFAPRPGGAYAPVSGVALEIDARVGEGGAILRSSAPRWVGRRSDGTTILASPPVAVGDRRLRVDVFRVSTDGSEASREECWARLPGPEQVLDSTVVLLDDEPFLLATTREADRLGLFDEKRLRVFPLIADRSRLGREAVLAVPARMNLWQEVRFAVVDVDADGRRDLVLGYWKGLRDDRVVLDVHRGRAEGGFRTKAETTAIDVRDGDRRWLRYGGDVDGDGRPDLVVRGAGALLVYRGRPASRRAAVVEPEPIRVPIPGPPGPREDASVTVSVGPGGTSVDAGAGGLGIPSVADLDGDGADDLVLPTPNGIVVLRRARTG